MKNNSTDIEILLSNSLNEIGYGSYDEYYEKEIFSKRKVIENTTKLDMPFMASEYEEKKYPVLRIISGIFQIFGGVTIIAVIVVAVILGKENVISAIVTLFVGGLIVLGAFATAESIKVLIDIEHNTRNKTK